MTESARYEISVDGVRKHRDSLEIAIEAANVLKASEPYSNVVVRDLLTGQSGRVSGIDALGVSGAGGRWPLLGLQQAQSAQYRRLS